ncbi:hypothetical protein AB4874_18305 [Thioclava sp. 15-R06ZXC-3]|uniref:Uncharacterized protein n=1 Tax=Thioclava arctica TaxID=3238301 RepID=A0ABV3TPL8_9RHOB
MTTRGHPLKSIESWPFSPPALGKPGTVEQQTSALVELLCNVSDGKLARALAEVNQPNAQSRNLGQRGNCDEEVQEADKFEAVRRWVRIHTRGLTWQIDLLGAPPNDRRKKMKETAGAHYRAAQRLRSFADKPDDADAASLAAAALEALPGDAEPIIGQTAIAPEPEKVTRETIEKIFSGSESRPTLIEWVQSHAQECEQVSKDINSFLKEHPAKGGAHLAAREIAKLVAMYFQHAREAAEAASLPLDNFPKVSYADDDNHEPRNPYCATVKKALVVFGQTQTGWRRAAEYVCEEQKQT